jgi:hypothetical protein
MSSELGPFEIDCDAPSYFVVRACEGLGFRTPQDVRWRRIDRRNLERPGGFFPWLRANASCCSCGQPLPALEGYTFTFISGRQTEYHLGQCQRCRTIFWDTD